MKMSVLMLLCYEMQRIYLCEYDEANQWHKCQIDLANNLFLRIGWSRSTLFSRWYIVTVGWLDMFMKVDCCLLFLFNLWHVLIVLNGGVLLYGKGSSNGHLYVLPGIAWSVDLCNTNATQRCASSVTQAWERVDMLTNSFSHYWRKFTYQGTFYFFLNWYFRSFDYMHNHFDTIMMM